MQLVALADTKEAPIQDEVAAPATILTLALNLSIGPVQDSSATPGPKKNPRYLPALAILKPVQAGMYFES